MLSIPPILRTTILISSLLLGSFSSTTITEVVPYFLAVRRPLKATETTSWWVFSSVGSEYLYSPDPPTIWSWYISPTGNVTLLLWLTSLRGVVHWIFFSAVSPLKDTLKTPCPLLKPWILLLEESSKKTLSPLVWGRSSIVTLRREGSMLPFSSFFWW